MGHKTLYAAVMFSLLGAVSTLHAEEPAATQASEPVSEESTPQSLTPEAIINPAPEAPATQTAAETPIEDSASPAPEQTEEATPAVTTETGAASPAQGPAAAEQPPLVTEQPQGDTLTIPEAPAATVAPTSVPAPAPSSARPMPQVDVAMPARGSNMSDVEKQYGKPKRKLAPVGQPPITRWVYDDYTVYFEHQLVIEAVKNQSYKGVPSNASQKPAKPAPAATDSQE